MSFLFAMIVLLVAVGFGIGTAVKMLATGAWWLAVIAVWVYPVLFLLNNVLLPILRKRYITAIIYAVGFVLAVIVVLMATVKFGGYAGIGLLITCELIAGKTT